MSEHNGVDIAPEDLRQMEMILETIDPNKEFVAKIVKMSKFEDNPVCPHCQHNEIPDKLREFSENFGAIMGDILMCKRCEGIIISLMYPLFAVKEPVTLRWRMKD